ncbi:hypothetical protein AAG906_018460 [Vitis piasezkii]
MPIWLKLFPLNSENLSNLLSLDLSLNVFIQSGDLAWLSHILSLRFLDLSLVDLGAAIHWSQAINKLPSLVHLNLNGCVLLPFSTGSLFHANFSALFNDLYGSILDGFGNMISLAYLDLGYCAFEGEILFAFGDMRALEYLDISGHGLHGFNSDTFGNMVSLEELFLSHNELEGEIPKSFGRRLGILDLSSNRLYGSIPDTVGSMVSLERLSFSESTPKLYLVYNKLNGTLPESIGQLAELVWFDIGSNSLQGTISKAHLFNLSNLAHLGLSSSSITFNMSLEWMASRSKPFDEFVIFNSEISDILQDWFWNLTFNFNSLNFPTIISRVLPNLSSQFSFFQT